MNQSPLIVYCDWNVFNKLEHIDSVDEAEKPVYAQLWQLIKNQSIIVPYSNAHISDLARGYRKNPEYADGHLANIKLITRNLCITEYWGDTQPRWHYRDPEVFLQDMLTEQDETAPDFSSLYQSLDDPLLSAGFELRKAALKLQRMPPAFQQFYQLNPIFNVMYPRTKTEMNLLAFCDDLYTFAVRIKTDYALYKQHKKMMIDLKNKFPQVRKPVTQAEKEIIGQPPYLNWDKAWDDLSKEFKVSYNPQANKIIGLFTTTDLKGYSQDEKFANMLDDATHCFYAAHGQYFLTIDKRCLDKSNLVYEKLKISTRTMTPDSFIKQF